MLNANIRLSSVPLDVRRASSDDLEVITPEEAKRRYMAIYRRNHPAPKPVVLATRDQKKTAPALVLVESAVVAPPPRPIVPPFVPPKFWTAPNEDDPTIDRERDWLIINATPKVVTIICETAAHYGVSVSDILSRRRTANVMVPRHIAMYLAKTLTLRSLPYIGRRFANRDHTTILHGVRKIESLIEAGDGLVSDACAAIKERLGVKE